MVVNVCFARYMMAVDRVERLLRSTCEALGAAGIEYAVTGGIAMAAWLRTVDEGAVRATKNVDVLLRRPDLERFTKTLRGVRLTQTECVECARPSPTLRCAQDGAPWLAGVLRMRFKRNRMIGWAVGLSMLSSGMVWLATIVERTPRPLNGQAHAVRGGFAPIALIVGGCLIIGLVAWPRRLP